MTPATTTPAAPAANRPSRRATRFQAAVLVLLAVLGAFPILAATADLAADRSAGVPADHEVAFERLAGRPFEAVRATDPGAARYVTTLEVGYALHELVFGVLFLVVVLVPLRRGERWAWWACWVLLAADLGYTFTFARYDPTLLRRALVADVALPVLLLAAIPRCFGRRRTANA